MIVFVVLLFAVSTLGARVETVNHNIVRNGTTYYSVRYLGLQLFESKDLLDWTVIGYIFDKTTEPGWATNHTYEDPEITALSKNEIRVYYVATKTSTNKRAIGVGFADEINPTGESYRTLGQPLLEDSSTNLYQPSVILPSNTTKRPILIFIAGTAPGIQGVTLSADGLDVLGKRFNVVEPTLDWEGEKLQNGWGVQRNEFYYVFYTGEDGKTLGVCRSEEATGPFEKLENPIGAIEDNSRKLLHKLQWDENDWPYFE